MAHNTHTKHKNCMFEVMSIIDMDLFLLLSSFWQDKTKICQRNEHLANAIATAAVSDVRSFYKSLFSDLSLIVSLYLIYINFSK